MKKQIYLTLIFTIIIGFSSVLRAEEEVLFGGITSHGGYGGPTISLGQFNEEGGLFVGGRGGWIINHSFSVGFGGWGLVSNNRVKDYNQEVYYWGYDQFGNYNKITKVDSSWYLSGGYGGLILEYIYNSNKIIHITGSLLIGAGSFEYRDSPISQDNHNQYMWEDNEVNYNKKYDEVFVLEPAINAEFNISKWFRINTGITYRIITGTSLPKTTDSQLSGLGGQIIFKFGKF